MKFKEFSLNTYGFAGIVESAGKHLEKIGYKFVQPQPNLRFTKNSITCFEDGEWVCGEGEGARPLISLDDFFKLTPKDVRVEPERFHCTFVVDYGGDGFNEHDDLTQDQIDRIKAIMEES